jgi:hypothetical protein
LRTGYTLNFLVAWERLHNPNFNVTDFGNIKMESTDNSFVTDSAGTAVKERLIHLNNMAVTQMKSLLDASVKKRLE